MARRSVTGMLLLGTALLLVACATSSATREACSACVAAGTAGQMAPLGGGSPTGLGGAQGGELGGSGPAGGGDAGVAATSSGASAGTGPRGGAAGTGGAPVAECRTVTGEEARALVSAGALLLDVRTAAEYSSGHIEGAINVSVDELAARVQELPRDRTIVVYCASGSRSARAFDQLCAEGFDVANMGPMSAWPG